MQGTPTPTAPDADSADPGLGSWSDSLLWFYLSLVIGLGATGALFTHYIAVDRAAVLAQLQRGVESLAAFATQPVPIDAIQQMFDSVIGPQGDLHGGAALSQDLLQRHLPPDPAALGFEAVSLGYLPRVSMDAIDQYGAQLGASESAGFPIVELDADGEIVRAAPRPDYFPVLLGTASAPAYVPLTGLDRAADAMQRLAMLQARDSGQVVMLTRFPMDDAAGAPIEADGRDLLVTHYYLAVYDSGMTPATPGERRARFAGLVAATSYQSSEDLFTLLSPTMQGIEAAYFPDSPLFDSDPDFAEIRALVESDAVAVARYVVPPGLPFMLVGRASPRLADVLATNTRWWVLCIGLVLTAWFASMALWFRNQAKRIKALVIARTQDLTERTAALAAANRALSDSEGRYRMLADNATDVIYTSDLNGHYTYVSPSIEAQRGFKPEELVGTPIVDVLPEHERRKLQVRYARIRDVALGNAAGEQPVDNKIEFQGYCKDGSLRWLETTVSFLHEPDGRLAGVLGVSRDISERKRAEQAKEELEDAYRQAQKMEAIGTLAGGIAHDFNNLLTGIYGYADILKSQVGANPRAHESIEIIEKAAARATELTSQLLGFARKGGIEAVSVDLNDSILEVISLLSRTIDRNITIQRQLSTRKPTVLGDSGQLAHLLLNLGINARDAMPEGGTLTFGVSVDELDEHFRRSHADITPGTYCHIRVADTGIGMDKAKMARIFEPFYTDKARGKGTGLGLAMVYGVARSHGGIVTVESEPGRGATFHVYIPYRQPDAL